jgi:hypothetical protein
VRGTIILRRSPPVVTSQLMIAARYRYREAETSVQPGARRRSSCWAGPSSYCDRDSVHPALLESVFEGYCDLPADLFKIKLSGRLSGKTALPGASPRPASAGVGPC